MPSTNHSPLIIYPILHPPDYFLPGTIVRDDGLNPPAHPRYQILWLPKKAAVDAKVGETTRRAKL